MFLVCLVLDNFPNHGVDKNLTQTTKVFIGSGISLFVPQLTALATKKF